MNILDYALPTERGVVYFSSVPRDMRPPEVRLHFIKFGEVLRMKFTPMPKKERRPGGPLLPLQFKEGWMEFASRVAAARAAEAMNGTPVQCKRQRKCYGQLWTVKYEPEMSWDTLIEEREGERRLRRAAEVQARREERDANEAYRRLVLGSNKQKGHKTLQSKQQKSYIHKELHNKNEEKQTKEQNDEEYELKHNANFKRKRSHSSVSTSSKRTLYDEGTSEQATASMTSAKAALESPDNNNNKTIKPKGNMRKENKKKKMKGNQKQKKKKIMTRETKETVQPVTLT